MPASVPVHRHRATSETVGCRLVLIAFYEGFSVLFGSSVVTSSGHVGVGRVKSRQLCLKIA